MISFRVMLLLIMVVLGLTVVYPEWLELKDILVDSNNVQKSKENSIVEKVIRKQKIKVSPVEQKKWIQATCAILTELNLRRHDLLGGRLKTHVNDVANAKGILNNAWKIHDREGLLITLNWIDSGGNRIEFNMLRDYLSELSADDIESLKKKYLNNDKIINKIEIVMKYHKQLGSKSLLGWDYARYVSLVGWGYVVGFLTYDEAWNQLMPVGRLLQQTFDSWEDLGNNYIIGRKYWSKSRTEEQGKQIDKIVQRLLTEPNSPWKRINWELDLATGWRLKQ
jgi:hypothetical protein